MKKPPKPQTPLEERVFVSQGRRHYRRSYSATEMRIGFVILLGLALVLAWVVWKGAHPDPELFSTGAEQLTEAPRRTSEPVERPARGTPGVGTPGVGTTGVGGAVLPYAAQGYGNPEAAAPAPTTASAPPAAAGDRGALPAGLAAAGWAEGPITQFDATNLYVKIDGREGYYKGFGFQRLHCVTLTALDDDSRTVDIEMYDLGKAENALGAYAGERGDGIEPITRRGGVHHFDRNALFLARGPFYVRAVGSEESPSVRAELDQLLRVLEADLAGKSLTGPHGLFVDALGFDAGKVAYTPENAFSFEFADSVYSATLSDNETELFVVLTRSPAAARELSGRFNAGFLEYGSAAGDSAGVAWARDRYIGTVAGTDASGVWLIGVRGAPDVATAGREISRLRRAVQSVPAVP